MRKKVLYTATSDIHLRTFHFPYLKWLINEGHEVHIACENRADIDLSFCHQVHYLPFKRRPFHPQNLTAYADLKRIIKEYQFDLIHCHTPAVSVLTRLAAIPARRKGTKVIYTAHGYHFFKGGPLKFWLSYYVIEKLLSKWTDAIILINQEDYLLTKKKFWNKHSFHLKGVGIDTSRFSIVNEEQLLQLRKQINISEDDFVLLYIAEFIPRKNHEFLIRSCAELIKNVTNAKFVFAGKGILLEQMKALTKKLQVDSSIRFLGWRDDVAQLAQMADVGISASKQEGLGLGLAEGMYLRLPIVATLDRGHKEMIEHGKNGFMFQQENTGEFIQYISTLSNDAELYDQFSKAAHLKSQEFLLENSLKTMGDIYRQFLN
jgi:glycosyltransferase EpsD